MRRIARYTCPDASEYSVCDSGRIDCCSQLRLLHTGGALCRHNPCHRNAHDSQDLRLYMDGSDRIWGDEEGDIGRTKKDKERIRNRI